MGSAEPRRTVIEGRPTLIVERTPPVPPTLQLLLEGGRDPSGRPWPAFRPARREPLRLGGARSACLAEDHRLADWLEGFYTGSDGISRTLLLRACQDCGAVCVRDVSFDRVQDYDPGGQPAAVRSRLAPRRRDKVIGWYTGARPNQRQYSS